MDKEVKTDKEATTVWLFVWNYSNADDGDENDQIEYLVYILTACGNETMQWRCYLEKIEQKRQWYNHTERATMS